MVMKLKIDPEFKALLPVPSDEELASLEKQIVEEGCLDPIRVWGGKDVVLDGHTRHGICERNGVKFKVTEIDLPSRAAARAWIIRNQLNRRNLTDERRRYFIGELYNAEVGGYGGNQDGSRKNAAKKVAKDQGVSPRTARRSGRRAKAIDAAAEKAPELRDAILDEKAAATTAELEEVAAAEPAKAKEKAKKIIAGENKKPKGKRKKKASEPAEPEPVKVTDANGRAIPSTSPFVEVFADREWFLAKIKQYKNDLADVRRMAHSPGGAALHVEECVARLKGLVAELEQRTPHAVCLVCNGEKMDPNDAKKECSGCGGLGWQDAFRYSISAKRRKGAR